MDPLHHLSFGVSVVGVLVIVLGVCTGLARFLRLELYPHQLLADLRAGKKFVT